MKIIGRITSLFGPTRVVLQQKEVRIPRIGVPVESSRGVSRHIDVVWGVHRHSPPQVTWRGSQLLGPRYCEPTWSLILTAQRVARRILYPCGHPNFVSCITGDEAEIWEDPAGIYVSGWVWWRLNSLRKMKEEIVRPTESHLKLKLPFVNDCYGLWWLIDSFMDT